MKKPTMEQFQAILNGASALTDIQSLKDASVIISYNLWQIVDTLREKYPEFVNIHPQL